MKYRIDVNIKICISILLVFRLFRFCCSQVSCFADHPFKLVDTHLFYCSQPNIKKAYPCFRMLNWRSDNKLRKSGRRKKQKTPWKPLSVSSCLSKIRENSTWRGKDDEEKCCFLQRKHILIIPSPLSQTKNEHGMQK
jgi:hypothetical protein